MNQKELLLLKKISSPLNSRLSVEEYLKFFLNNLCSFYSAESCLLVATSMDRKSYTLYRSNQTSPDSSIRGVENDTARMLMALPAHSAVSYSVHRALLGRDCLQIYQLDDVEDKGDFVADENIYKWIGSPSFLAIPLIFHRHTIGRVYICDQKKQFSQEDAEFVFLLMNYLVLTMRNTEVIDRLARDAANDERQRIARDIHDSIIQPYIGLQMGLDGLEQKILRGDNGVLTNLHQLQELCREGTLELREYVRRLRDGDVQGAGLLPSVHRFADKFSSVTGIDVQVEVGSRFRIHDCLSAEIFQMIAEGLSNIRRHTQSEQAVVRLDCEAENLLLSIENGGQDEWLFAKEQTELNPPFTPRSIDERARALGGFVRVETRNDGGTVVRVTVPLS